MALRLGAWRGAGVSERDVAGGRGGGLTGVS